MSEKAKNAYLFPVPGLNERYYCLAAVVTEAQAQRVLRGGLLGAGGGALLGGIIDGDDGAAVGAVVGGMTGMIVASERERQEVRRLDQGFCFNSNNRCYYEHPSGNAALVKNGHR